MGSKDADLKGVTCPNKKCKPKLVLKKVTRSNEESMQEVKGTNEAYNKGATCPNERGMLGL